MESNIEMQKLQLELAAARAESQKQQKANESLTLQCSQLSQQIDQLAASNEKLSKRVQEQELALQGEEKGVKKARQE